MSFIFKGEEVDSSPGSMLGAMTVLCETKKDATDLLQAYAEDIGNVETAKSNIGYLAGYCDKELHDKLLDLFDVEHPVWGKEYPASPREAFRIGGKWMLDQIDKDPKELQKDSEWHDPQQPENPGKQIRTGEPPIRNPNS